jgi:hypothetical protein
VRPFPLYPDRDRPLRYRRISQCATSRHMGYQEKRRQSQRAITFIMYLSEEQP